MWVDRTANTTSPGGGKHITHLAVSYRKHPTLWANPVATDVVPKLYPQPRREVDAFVFPLPSTTVVLAAAQAEKEEQRRRLGLRGIER